MFEFVRTKIPGVILIVPDVKQDGRGSFFEMWNYLEFRKYGLDCKFIQANQSISKKGVLRGLHFQRAPYAQSKLVRTLNGAIYDVAVDLRPGSLTYGHYVGANLNAQNKHMLYIPAGCAHGFISLFDQSQVMYLCNAPYHQQSEGGIRYDDPDIAIRWPIAPTLISQKDHDLPYLKDANLENII